MSFRNIVGKRSSSNVMQETPTRPNFRTQDIVVDEAQVRAHLAKQNSTTVLKTSTPALAESGEDHNDPDLLDGYWRLIQLKLGTDKKQSTGDNIVVVTRTRPFNDREMEANTTKCVRVLAEDSHGQQQVWIVNPNAPEAGPVKFSFDYCFDSFDEKDENFVNQKMVFDTVGLDLLAKTWSGYNSSLFAYGQTGSGKTYSIMGYDKAKGLIPRICGLLFYMIETHGKSRGLQVDATYLEIYQERIIDLLNASAQTGPIKPKDRLKLEAKRKKLMSDKSNEANMLAARELLKQLSPNYQGAAQPKVREDPVRGVVVDNLRRFAVSSYQDCADLLEEGLTNRTTAATAMNSTSSRSHAVFTLEITEKEEKANATEDALMGKSGKKKAQTTKITLIDLAGSERAKSADTKGARLKEGGAINKSLSVLGHVISLLAKDSNDQVAEEERQMAAAESSPGKKKSAKKESAGPDRHIPFRDSVLTWILRDSLVGNSKTVMLAALSPAAINFQETLSTLRFANQAKLIKTKAVRNEDPTERLIRELQEEIFLLKEKVAYLEGEGAGQGNGGAIGGGGGSNFGGGGNGGPPPQQYSDYLASMGVFEPENDYDVGTNFEQNFEGDGYEGASEFQPHYDGQGGEMVSADNASSQLEANALNRANQAERIAAMAADSERRAVAALLLAEERRQKAERNMADLRARLQHRRKVVRLHRLSRNATDEGRDGESVEEEQNRLVSDGGPYLTFLSEDPSMSSQLKIYVAAGQRLRVGTSSAKIEQDVKVAGLGITPETAVFTMKSKKDGLTLCVSPASMNAQVRVNGTLLSYRSTNSSGKKSKEECYLKVNDRIVLGTCAHVLLVCESESARLSRHDLSEGVKLANYEKAVREVVLQRTESQEEYGRRLAAMVMNKFRGPRSRAVFAATMVRALRGVFEANEVAVSMGTNKRFKVHVGGLVDNDNLFSLRLDEVLPHQKAHVTVQVLLHSHEYRSSRGEGGSSSASDNEPWCTCELDEFLDLVEDLKTTLQSCRAVAESVVTPAGQGETYGPDVGVDGVSAVFKTGRGAGAITRAFFMAADEDGDGVISRDELVDAASALGLTPSEAEMDTLFRQYDVESNNELSLGEFDQFVRDQLCAKFDECLMKVKSRRKHQEGRAKAEIAAHLQQHLQALQTQLQLAVRMKEYDIAVELEENVQHVQDELASFKRQQMEESGMDEADTHAELLRMKEEALQYSADLRRALMDLADSHAALLMALEPLLDAGKGADIEELEGVAAAGFTAARVGEAASQVAHDLQVLVQGNAAEDAANDELAEMAASQLIAGRKVSQNAMKALEDRVGRNSNGDMTSPKGNSRRLVTPDDQVLLKNVSHARDIVNRLVGTSGTMSRVEEDSDEEGGTRNPLVPREEKEKKKKKKKKSSRKERERGEEEEQLEERE